MRRRTVDARRRPVVVSVGSRTPDHRFGWRDAVCAGRVAARRWERAAWAGDRWIDGLTRRGCASGRSSSSCGRGLVSPGAVAHVAGPSSSCGRGLVSPGAVAHVAGPSSLCGRGLVSPGAVAHVLLLSRIVGRAAVAHQARLRIGGRPFSQRGMSGSCHQARLRMSGSSPAPRSSTGGGHQARLRTSAPFGLRLPAGRVFTRRDCASGPPPRSAASARRGRRYRGHGHAQQSVQPLRRPLPAVTLACATTTNR
jgi:hypothetical protein